MYLATLGAAAGEKERRRERERERVKGGLLSGRGRERKGGNSVAAAAAKEGRKEGEVCLLACSSL
jgi:hypothetical protein